MKHFIDIGMLNRNSSLLALTVVLAGCSTPPSREDMNATVNRLADRYVESSLERQPELAYFTGLPAPTHARFMDNSLEALAQWQAFENALYAELEEVEPAALTAREWVAWGALKERIEASRMQRICRSELWQGVNHMFGWHLQIAEVAARQPVSTAEERAAALARWTTLPARIDTEIANLKHGLDRGYSAAKAVAEAMLVQVESMIAQTATESPLYSMARRANDSAFSESLEQLIDGDIRAATTRYRDFLKDTYIRAAREELAVAANPDGEACYAAMLRGWTTLDRKPRAVYELGKVTVDANRAYVISLAQELYGLDSVRAIVAHVNEADDNHFASPTALVEHSRRIVEAARGKSEPLFASLPETPVEVNPFPVYQRGSGRSSHYVPPGDAGQPGEYRISTDFWKKETVSSAEITAVHEAWPGHHLQIARALSLDEQHPIVKLGFNSGYTEGWARYAETLAEDAGMYTVEYARITRRLWPARGMVADPALHLYGWTAEQAADYLVEAGRFSPEESRVLITRMAAIPGQLSAYDSGALTIAGLRADAEEKLGARFDLQVFHERVLENGALPLWQLEEHVRAWIADEAAR